MATYTKDKDVETTLEDDAEARDAMREVFSNTARWPTGFKGFTADVVANINGEEQKVKVTVSIFGRPTPIELDFFQIELEK